MKIAHEHIADIGTKSLWRINVVYLQIFF